MSNIKEIIKGIIFISRVTKVTNKKIRIILSVLLTNISVYLDILIILLFTYLLTRQDVSYSFLEIFVNNIFLLPVIVLIRYGFTILEKANIFDVQKKVEKNLRTYLLTQVYKSGNYSIADSMYYTNIFSSHIGYFYLALTNFLNSIIQLLVYGSFLIYADLKTVSVFGIGAITLLFPTRYLLKLGRKYMQEDWDTGQDSNRGVERVIKNMFLIKILKTENFEIKRFDDLNNELRNAQFKNNFYGAINTLLPNFVTILLISVLVVFFDILESLTLEFLGVTLRLVQSLGSMNQALNKIINSQVHIKEFMNLENNKLISPKNYYKVNKHQKNAVEIKNLNFRYFNSDDSIFENLNLSIPKNSHTVVTGGNGSGKSTLLGLISQVFYPIDGEITVYTNKLGYVGAIPLILDDTLRKNLLYGNQKDIADEELYKILEEFDYLIEDESSLNLKISSNSLSLGQMQKISYMRALLNDTELLLLDESTANLDSDTRDLIFSILEKKEITILNSTHNPEEFKFTNNLKINFVKNKRDLIFE